MIRRSERTEEFKAERVSGNEISKIYMFEPGDMTKYLVMVTTFDCKDTRQIVGGVNDEYFLVTLISGFGSFQSYPIDFSHAQTLQGHIGYLGTKFNIDNSVAEKLEKMLEYIRNDISKTASNNHDTEGTEV